MLFSPVLFCRLPFLWQIQVELTWRFSWVEHSQISDFYCSFSEVPWEIESWGMQHSSFICIEILTCPSWSTAALLFWLFSSFLPGRRQIQSSEDGFLSSSFNLRYHGHSRSAKNGYQHQEPDPAEYHLAPLSPVPQTRKCRQVFAGFLFIFLLAQTHTWILDLCSKGLFVFFQVFISFICNICTPIQILRILILA